MPLWEDNWLWRGFQSALFLYISCGPCYAAAYKRKRKKEAKADRKRNAEMLEEHFRQGHRPQPAPFETNPYWNEEIALGPNPQVRRGMGMGTIKGKRNREYRTSATNSTAGSSSDEAGTSPDSAFQSKPALWNSKRYQRADEEFTTLSSSEEAEATRSIPTRRLSTQGPSIGVSGWSAESTRHVARPEFSYHFPARAPHLNDLSPPATSTVPIRKAERAWMTAAPPSAAFMEGKKGVTRRSRSSLGERSGRDVYAIAADRQPGRLFTPKVIDDNVKTVQTPGPGHDAYAYPSRAASGSSGRRGTNPHEKGGASPRKTRNRPVAVPLHWSSSSETELATGVDHRVAAVDPPPLRSVSNGNIPNPVHALPRASHLMTRPPFSSTHSAGTTATTKTQMATISGAGYGINNNDGKTFLGASPSRSPSSATLSPRSSISSASASLRGLSPSNLRASDNYVTSQRKRSDTTGPATDKTRLSIRDSSLNTSQSLVEPCAFLDSKFIQSPSTEAKKPLSKENIDDAELWVAGGLDEEEDCWVRPKRWSIG